MDVRHRPPRHRYENPPISHASIDDYKSKMFGHEWKEIPAF